MISTKDMNIALAKRKRLERVTTKDIDASIKVIKPKKEERMKSPLISTHNIGSVEEVEDKKKRDEILAQRKGFTEDDPVYLNKDGVLVPNEKEEETIKKHMEDIDGKRFKTTEDMNLEMRDDKKVAMAERMAKARETKKDKKDEEA